jgi:putative transposase
VIVLEDLHVRGMQRNRSLALSLGDASLGELCRQLAYKSEWHGARLVIVDRFFPSSQLCSSCDTLNEQMKGPAGLRKRLFECAACGLVIDRDENAALNLRRYGLRVLAAELPEGLREVTPVGEEGSGPPRTRRTKPASLKQEASRPRRPQRATTQRHAERRAGTTSNVGGTSD